MLSDEKPFAGETVMDTIGAILNKEPISLHQLVPGIQPEIERIVNKTLRKDRDERYQTASDLLLDLNDVWEELEFQKKLLISSSVAGKIPKSSDKLNSKKEDEAKTLIFEVPKTAESVLPESDENIHTSSSAEYIAGEVRKHKLGLLGALGVLAVALAAIGYFTNFRVKPINSIAVLPFVNVGDAFN